ncbi:hypothetical protein DOTSEDRAFT_166905 [Dothistroma septosporum NZE10]|uniref:Glycoside hydrolase family 23 protein n=1 Tax=Dothistroma septosporum (strain NZE10 / CBS 128990) TaxID=675120 RepID=N1PWA9_DOTSN|nr:hypothetical protein DOTSEDRAFT_166905 [Dothistroma septosporum NZE10]
MVNMSILPLTALFVASTTALPFSIAQRQSISGDQVGYAGSGMFRSELPAPSTTGASNPTTTYTHYTGDGSVAAGWPSQTDWIDYDIMWIQNKAAFIDQQPNTPSDNDNLHDAIISISTQYNIDKRLILAIVIQESHGNVRVETTQFPQGSNPGLMQSHDGKGSCAGLATCPKDMIDMMIEEGSATGSDGINLKDLIDGCAAEDVSKYYIAARKYNSGVNSIGPDGDLLAPGATASYAVDIANRLVGYVGGQGGQ